MNNVILNNNTKSVTFKNQATNNKIQIITSYEVMYCKLMKPYFIFITTGYNDNKTTVAVQ